MAKTKLKKISEADLPAASAEQLGALAESGRKLISATQMLGASHWASLLRTWCVPFLFGAAERIFAAGIEPHRAVGDLLNQLTTFVEAGAICDLTLSGAAAKSAAAPSFAPVEEITGEHYGRLFRHFSQNSYLEEPARLLRQRLTRNGLAIEDFAGRRVIDVGCGGGRYSAAWRILGASQVVGYDISSIGLRDARQRVEAAKIDGVVFQKGNVLSLPFAENSFDVVFSNGVLHHTTDWAKGIGELVRVLKSGGFGWLYLIENSGGIFWDVIEILRVVMRDEEKTAARNALKLIGVPANRIFYLLDHVMVPISIRLTPQQIETALETAGATGIRRLTRGADFDRIEQIYQRRPFAETNFGVGENRYVFSK